MAEAAATAVKRKLMAKGGGGDAVLHAFGQAIARAAHDLFALSLRVNAQSISLRSLTELPELLEDHALLTLLDGPKEAIGLCAVGAGLLSALIEMQMTGRIGPTAPDQRRPTRTDAAMISPFVDAVLMGVTAALEESDDRVWASGFNYASCLEDPRPLQLLLEDGALKVLRIGLLLGNEAIREGSILLALPSNGRAQAPASGTGNAAEGARDWSQSLERAVLGAPVVAEALLGRIRLSAQGMLDLRPGMLLPLPSESIGRATLEVGLGGTFARGRLGRMRGMRALRIDELSEIAAPEPAVFVTPLPPPMQGLGSARSSAATVGADRADHAQDNARDARARLERTARQAS
ncbi:FliM/FliN family flagellar motor switch protein [Defluviimonas sp. WL0002]|uniref:FliM/FliN family flagellar motor switch protein n=1 Tax=Albidovulum marisflavi TaxID=2984159 RepID=A0ABT2ZGF6_9RHOB|nr:FliM/FliN family flagellar motor switch protein [Defluviimonas sp. WL0002]MCV2870191.1 FliM/FliN family flagellar motor switch protein [Defluviimonas sp. WL0002]